MTTPATSPVRTLDLPDGRIAYDDTGTGPLVILVPGHGRRARQLPLPRPAPGGGGLSRGVHGPARPWRLQRRLGRTTATPPSPPTCWR